MSTDCVHRDVHNPPGTHRFVWTTVWATGGREIFLQSPCRARHPPTTNLSRAPVGGSERGNPGGSAGRSTGRPDNGGPPRPGSPGRGPSSLGCWVRGRRHGGTPDPPTRSQRPTRTGPPARGRRHRRSGHDPLRQAVGDRPVHSARPVRRSRRRTTEVAAAPRRGGSPRQKAPRTHTSRGLRRVPPAPSRRPGQGVRPHGGRRPRAVPARASARERASAASGRRPHRVPVPCVPWPPP